MGPLLLMAWGAVVVYLVTCLLALVLVLLRQLRPPQRTDKTFDRILWVLVSAVVVQSSAAVIGWLALVPPASRTPHPLVVRTLATNDIKDPVLTANEGSNGVFRIPAGHRARLIAVETARWTDDPLDSIEWFVRNVKFEWDISKWTRAYEAANGDCDAFVQNYINPQFDRMVVRKLVSDREALQRKEYEELAASFIRARLVPMIAIASDQQTDVVQIDCRPHPGSIDDTRQIEIPFWKRVIAVEIADAEHMFGPFVNGRGYDGPPRQGEYKEFPLPSANRAALIAVEYQRTGASSYTAASERVAFNAPDSVITNTSSFEKWFRLLMNDNIPEDNGPGYADAFISIEPLDAVTGK